MDCKSVVAKMPPVPESVERVLCSLYGHEPMTMQTLQQRCGLARRTVYGAVRRLRELGVIRDQVSLRDSRQTYIWLDPERIEGGVRNT